MLIRYLLILIAYLLFLSVPDLDHDTKYLAIVIANTITWLFIAIFWLWVYVASTSRKLIVSKIVKILIAVSVVAVSRGFLVFFGVTNPYITGGLTLLLAGIVALETYDLWLKAGRKVDRLPETERISDIR